MHIGINGIVMAFIATLGVRGVQSEKLVLLNARTRGGLRASDGGNEVLDRLPLNIKRGRVRERGRTRYAIRICI